MDKTLTHQLTPQQLADLNTLLLACQGTDGNTIAVYKPLLTQPRLTPCTLLYDHTQLIGFVTPFFFEEDTSEIALMVAPSHRQQGLGTSLLKAIQPLLIKKGITTCVFSTPHDRYTDKLTVKGLSYQHSEYRMRRVDPKLLPIKHKEIHLRLATEADLSLVCAMDDACFPQHENTLMSRFYGLIHDPFHTLWIAERHGTPIGKAHVHWEEEAVRLTDLAILPAFQKQGFGRAMVAQCINDCIRHHRTTVSLDVEATNQHALTLYTHLGFVMDNAYDFWSIPSTTLLAV